MKNEGLEILWTEIESDLEDIETIVGEVEGLKSDIEPSAEDPSQRDKAPWVRFCIAFITG